MNHFEWIFVYSMYRGCFLLCFVLHRRHLVTKLCLTLCDSMDCNSQAPASMNSPGKNTGVGCHFPLHCLFCILTSNCSGIICWKDYPFPIELPLHLFKGKLTIFVWVHWWTLREHFNVQCIIEHILSLCPCLKINAFLLCKCHPMQELELLLDWAKEKKFGQIQIRIHSAPDCSMIFGFWTFWS